MTAMQLQVNALSLIAIGTPEEQEEGLRTLRMLRDGLYPAPVLEDTVDELMEELYMTEGRICFQIIRTALIQAYQHPTLMDCVSKGLYMKVGEIYQIPSAAVGQNIQRGIEIAYRLGEPQKLDAYFRHLLSGTTGAPTPVNFLRQCLRDLRVRMEILRIGGAENGM